MKDKATIAELDGLRGIAILAVLMFHFARDLAFRWISQPSRLGWMGVDLFFVLSGFLITGILLDTKGQPGFYFTFVSRRAFRILPLYYVCLTIYIIVTVCQRHSLSGSDSMWFSFYLGNVPQAIRNVGPDAPFFGPLWSLQIEEQFYLLYPLLIAYCSPRSLGKALRACVAAALLIRVLLLATLGDRSRLASYVMMPYRMDALALGGLVALGVRNGGWPRSFVCAGLLTGAVGCMVMFHFRPPLFRDPLVRSVGFTLIAFSMAALLQVVLQSRQSTACAALRWAPLRYTGRIAYGLYLLQMPAAAITERVPVGHPGTVAFLVVTVSISYALASLSWFLFERPIVQLRDRLHRSFVSSARGAGGMIYS